VNSTKFKIAPTESHIKLDAKSKDGKRNKVVSDIDIDLGLLKISDQKNIEMNEAPEIQRGLLQHFYEESKEAHFSN